MVARALPDLSDPAELAKVIATPTRMAMAIGAHVTGWEFTAPPHLLHIERKVLDAVLDETRQRLLMVNLPPRHGKSQYMAWLIAWLLGMYPEKRIMFITYSDDFSATWGRLVKTIHQKFGKQLFGRTVAADASSNADWKLEGTMGGMLSAGILGNITGRDADIIIVDDIVKNIQEANSKATKKLLIETYDSAIRPRLEPTGTMIVVSTRWAEDDLAGTLQSREKENPAADRWEKVILPALAEPSEDEEAEMTEEEHFAAWEDEIGRHMGEPLWPDRYTADVLHIMQANDPVTFATLYQQKPNLREGGMFPANGWKYYDPENMPPMVRKVTKWDLAATDEGGDWTVGLHAGLGADSKIYVLDVWRFRKHSLEVERTVTNTAFRHGTAVPIGIEQERAGAGKALVAHYKRLLRGWTVEGEKPDGSKEDRAAPLSAGVAMGTVLLPEGAPWLPDFIHEFKVFPRGRNDDQVDTLVYAFNDLYQGSGGVSAWSPVGVNLEAEELMRRILLGV